MEKKRAVRYVVITAVCFLILGFLIGYTLGVTTTIKWIAEKAVYFLKLDINSEEFARAINEYKIHINERYP